MILYELTVTQGASADRTYGSFHGSRALVEDGRNWDEGASVAALSAAHGSIMGWALERRDTRMGSTCTWDDVRQHTSSGDLW